MYRIDSNNTATQVAVHHNISAIFLYRLLNSLAAILKTSRYKITRTSLLNKKSDNHEAHDNFLRTTMPGCTVDGLWYA